MIVDADAFARALAAGWAGLGIDRFLDLDPPPDAAVADRAHRRRAMAEAERAEAEFLETATPAVPDGTLARLEALEAELARLKAGTVAN